MNKPLALLNNLTPSQFLAEYWQKKPLLIKKALPDFNGLLSPNELAGLACEEDVLARIVSHKKGKWSLKNGPFGDADFTKLPKTDWTLLVQNVNHHLPEAADLLAMFNFIPHARLDDLMVSYAPKGSGIGAHVDSYDVFLLQGAGKRNWKISAQKDLSLVENTPLKILQNFKAEQEWTLEAGDMLYLPPQIAHWGVSESDDCMTYSIGFRAPKTEELAYEFLNYLQDNLQDNFDAESLYTDADLALQKHPAEISEHMVKRVSGMLQKLTWDKQRVADFLGQYLTEPKLGVVFSPARKISEAEFTKRLATKTLMLSLKSQLLFTPDNFYLNGERLVVPDEISEVIKHLADKRYLNITALQVNIHEACSEALYEAYLAGYVCFKHKL
jgi:50S ribosomal protein L16 3-hydroxylase